MAHYAFINEENIVTQVITGIDENEKIDGVDPETWYGNFKNQKCLRTSYNKNIRKNFAGVGYFYDENVDAFIPPKPYASWILDENSFQWVAPVQIPNDDGQFYWDEVKGDWIEIS
jgi:hypothetical protein